MGQPLLLRRASVDEFEVVLGLLCERIDWLRAQGSDQWSSWQKWRTKMAPAVEAGDVWLLLDDGEPVATITLEFHGDTDFWTPAECAEPAVYLSKLATRLDRAGAELGSLLLRWATDHAYRRGARYLRLDAWKTNPKLHDYYRTRGWVYLRTANHPNRRSGALFQTEARPTMTSPDLVVDDPAAVLLPTEGGGGLAFPDAANNWHPDHLHRGGLRVQYDVLSYPRPAEWVDFMRYRLTDDTGTWLLESDRYGSGRWHREGAVLDAEVALAPGTRYVVTHQEKDDGCRMVLTPEVP